MIRIISDTSTMYSTAEAAQLGFDVSCLSVTIAGKSYQEFDEISSEEFVSIIRQGHMPTSSQPPIGKVEALYNRYPDDEILNICLAHGLSGTYQNALAAAQLCEHNERITVINTRTLCGPHRYMVEQAVQWVKDGLSVKAIVERLNALMDSAKSYLIPADFDYLRRGGRLSPLVSYVGKAANLTPIMTQTENGERLTAASIRRGFAHAVKYVAEALKKANVGKGWQVQVTHAAAPEKAELARDLIQAALPDVHIKILPLSPAFITQGGPGCVAIQCVKLG